LIYAHFHPIRFGVLIQEDIWNIWYSGIVGDFGSISDRPKKPEDR
jgi:hypothetical protein